MLAEFIRHQIANAEKEEADRRFELLCRLPVNTFDAIYAECFFSEEIDDCTGTRYNGTHYSEWEIYFASHARDSDAEVLF